MGVDNICQFCVHNVIRHCVLAATAHLSGTYVQTCDFYASASRSDYEKTLTTRFPPGKKISSDIESLPVTYESLSAVFS